MVLYLNFNLKHLLYTFITAKVQFLHLHIEL